MVYTALLVTKMTLGCGIPDEILNNLSVHPVRAAAIRFLSRRMSFTSLSSLRSGRNMLSMQHVGLELLLPIVTYEWHQQWRRLRMIYRAHRHGTVLTREIKQLLGW